MEIAAPGPGPRRAAGAPRHQPLRRDRRGAAPAASRRSTGRCAGDLAERHARRDEAELPRRRPATGRDPRPLHGHGAATSGPRSSPASPAPSRDRPDQQATLAAFRGPALVLMGEDDRLCPRDRHELMHALMPQSRLAIIAGAGHLPTAGATRSNHERSSSDGWLAMIDDALLALLRRRRHPDRLQRHRGGAGQTRLRRLHPRHRGRLARPARRRWSATPSPRSIAGRRPADRAAPT